MAAAADHATIDYPPTQRSRIKRQHERAHYDRKTVHEILDAGLLCHVGYTIDGQPYVTPTCYWRDGERVYWHGSGACRSASPCPCSTAWCWRARATTPRSITAR
jgi:hypothetical protein